MFTSAQISPHPSASLCVEGKKASTRNYAPTKFSLFLLKRDSWSVSTHVVCIFHAKPDLVGENVVKITLLDSTTPAPSSHPSSPITRIKNLDHKAEFTDNPPPSRIGTSHAELRDFGYELAQNTPQDWNFPWWTGVWRLSTLDYLVYSAKGYYLGQTVVQKELKEQKNSIWFCILLRIIILWTVCFNAITVDFCL